MPFFSLVCDKCKNKVSKVISVKSIDKKFYCDCGGELKKKMSDLLVQELKTVDEDRGKVVEGNLKDTIEERSQEHFYTHVLPKIIDEHGMEHAIRNGWMDEEGKIIRK